MFCSSTPATGVFTPVSFFSAVLVDVGRAEQAHLAFELDRVGQLPFAFAQLVGERHADRQLAFELVGRADAGGDARAFAPVAVRVLVVRAPSRPSSIDTSAGLIGSCLIDGSMLWMNGSVASILRSTLSAGRDSIKRASVTYICSSSFTSFFDPSMILWTMPSLKFGKRLRNLCSTGRVRRPFIEPDEGALVGGFVGAVIVEEDGLRLELVDGGAGDRSHLHDLEVLRAGEGDGVASTSSVARRSF